MRLSAPLFRNLHFLPVILTCDNGITLVESVFDTT